MGAYLAAWLALDFGAAEFETSPEVSVWYPPSALDFALLLAFGLRYWPALLANTPLHAWLVSDTIEFGWAGLVAFDLATTAGYAGAAWFLARVARIDPGLRGLRDVVWLVAVAAFAAPLLVAALQVLNLSVSGDLPRGDALINTLRYWAGDATGIGMLAPLLLVLARRLPGTLAHRSHAVAPALIPAPIPDPPRPARRGAGWLLAGEALAFALGVWAAYGWQRPATLDYSFFAWIPMIWAALRYGFERTAWLVLALNLAIAILTRAQFGATSAFALQFGLMALTLTGLLLGAYSSEMRRARAALRHEALHDALTGLLNRVLFRDRLAQGLADRRRPGRASAVVLLDLDHFKDTNDTLGHGAGDALLAAVAARLRATMRAGDTVARLGGDEFGLLLGDLANVAEAEVALARAMRQFDEPFAFDGHEARISASAGATLCPEGERDPDVPLRQADLALYRAKAEGRAAARFFSPDLTERLRARLETERDLGRALREGHLVLEYQPQVDAATCRVVAAEALIRWEHPERGLLPPAAFLPFAESAGVMAAIGDWVLRTACAEAAAWPDPTVAVAVNVAPAQWRGDVDLLAVVDGALAASGLAPARLTLEITEDALLLAEEASCLAALHRLRRLGVQVSVDDLGIGHSGLSRLRRFPIDEIKIDRSFVAGIGRNADDEAIVGAVVGLGRALGRRVVAEGVESEAQLAFLRAAGCGLAQGFLFGRPLRPEAFAALLARDRAGEGGEAAPGPDAAGRRDGPR